MPFPLFPARWSMRGILPIILLLASLGLWVAAPGKEPEPPLPDGREAARKAMARFRVPAGLKVELFAAEPMLGSPVALCLDEQGRVYVAEEYRFNRGTEENRSRPFLLEDDLQIQTVDDRLKVYRKWAHKFDGGMDWFSRHADQVRLLIDRDGDGKADTSTVFAGGFNDPLDGLAAGVIARQGNVYLTCIPHLWLLKDTDGDGKADVRKPLLRGFGVNCAFLGHDLHGLVWGPDGRLYFSVGDRGFHVKTREGKVLSGPRTGAVFRCDPDGANLEVVATGMRNPQELAFDQYGNLFAADNNCDKGDHSRLVYVVEGGNSGWNMAYQTIPAPYLTGPWHAERLWHLPHKGQPAWIVPPVGKLGAGPSGFAFTSGLSLPGRYRDRFFLCNYTGNGGVESFGVKPQGAGFAIVDHHDFLKPISATDVAFGYDGKVYVSDFVGLNWDGRSAGGRIYTVQDPKRLQDPVVQQIKKLFREGFKQRPAAELARLLAHPDQGVRLRAQYALAEQGEQSVTVFRKGATTGKALTRLHAIWGLGQVGRKHAEVLKHLLPLLEDEDAEVRAQTARVLGDNRWADAAGTLVGLLRDSSPRVRFFAAQALGRIGYRPAVAPLVAMLKENADADPFLRHAGVTALAAIGDVEGIQARARDSSVSVRLAVLLAQRRLKDTRLTQFLKDADLFLATEAARAIHDLPIESGIRALAGVLNRFEAGAVPIEAEPLLRRAVNAHFRLGGLDNARAVVRVAANSHFPPAIRAEALSALGEWSAPGPRDRVTGFWRPLPKRDPKIVQQAMEESATRVLNNTSGKLRAQATWLVARLGIKVDDATFLAWVADRERDADTRIAALRLVASRKPAGLDRALAAALKDANARLRAEARDVLADIDPVQALDALGKALEGRVATVEKQQALATLARMKAAGAGRLLDRWAGKLAAGKVDPALQLDLLEALKAAPTAARTKAAQSFKASLSRKGALGKHGVSLHGGDAERGRALFVGHAVAQCIRCHTVNSQGGTAGPDLSKVASRNPEKTRDYLLESLIAPNARIAEGFGSVTLTLDNGKIVGGTLKAEKGESVTLELPDGKVMTVPRKRIEGRTELTSAMPPMERVLSARELRDLVEFLAGLK
jgi:quinoprotein glucose dehydrogenase